MTPAIALLLILRTASTLGMPVARLVTELRFAAHDMSAPEVEAELRKLADVRQVIRYAAGAAGTRWRITGEGNAHLTEGGL